MKHFLVGIGLAALLLAAPVSAQPTMRFDVPFAFVAGNEVLPAGVYRVTVDANDFWCRLDPVNEGETRLVRLVPGATTRPQSRGAKGVLRFARLGGQYYLTAVWRDGTLAGNETINSRRVTELAKAAAPVELTAGEAGLK